ncbi:MAG TPA: hypothetical protein DD730_16470 [Desulfosporosinus sp.]|nr:hypothetical protein [Desulfosporosinus sp.]
MTEVLGRVPPIFPPEAKPYGYTFGEWSAKWWQWVLSIPKADNPGNDKTGISSTLKQEGPVWFLVGTFENMQVAERTCHIPIGKAILFPVITSEKNNLEFPELKTELELRLRAKDAIDRVTNFSASIDGVKVEGLHNFRVQSPLFEVTFPENNIYEVLPSTVHTVSDGFWVMVKPLSTGNHQIRFCGEARCQKDALEFKTDVIYHLEVI